METEGKPENYAVYFFIIHGLKGISPYQSCSLGNQKRVFGIMSQALPECEELSEVQCCYFASCKEPCPYYSSGPYPVCMVDVSEHRGNGFHSVSDFAIELVLFISFWSFARSRFFWETITIAVLLWSFTWHSSRCG